MLTYTDLGQTLAPGTAILGGGALYALAFCPSARPFASGPTYPTSGAKRTATNTYSKGYKETVSLTSNNSSPWIWRRVAFEYSVPTLIGDGISGSKFALETAPNGMVRVARSLSPAELNVLGDVLWDGTVGLDWNDHLTAKTDSSVVKIHYDKTRVLNPGAAAGLTRMHKQWHPTGKQLVYDDDENGANELSGNFANQSRIGMKDIIIIDFFLTPTADTAARLLVNYEGTYYWHER